VLILQLLRLSKGSFDLLLLLRSHVSISRGDVLRARQPRILLLQLLLQELLLLPIGGITAELSLSLPSVL